MTDDDDPFVLHAHRFLSRLQGTVSSMAEGAERVDGLTGRLNKLWPQVLAGFWWAARCRDDFPVAKEICDAFQACANGDITAAQFRRSAADFLALARNVAEAARRQSNANDAAFLYHFAGVTMTQAHVLELTEKTGADIRSVMQVIAKSIRDGETAPDAGSESGGGDD